MNFGELKDDVLGRLLDNGQNVFTPSIVGRAVNAAMRHVANWADTKDESLFVTSAQVTSAGDGERTYTFNASESNPFNILATVPVKRPLTLSIVTAGGKIGLEPFEHEEIDKWRTATSDAPVWATRGLSIIIPNGKAAQTYEMLYVHALPDMVIDGDTPGRNDGAGVHDRLPIDYHGLVSTYATVLLATSERSQTDWRAVYNEQRDELAVSLFGRRGALRGANT